MLKSKLLLAALVAVLGAAAAASAGAEEKSKPKRGGYSYSPSDTINTYGGRPLEVRLHVHLPRPQDRSSNERRSLRPTASSSTAAWAANGGDSPYMN